MSPNNANNWNATPEYGDGSTFIRCHDPSCPCQINPRFLRDPLVPVDNRRRGQPSPEVSPRAVQDDPNRPAPKTTKKT
jgi:hypothetical protein